jgi:hypothetical protein
VIYDLLSGQIISASAPTVQNAADITDAGNGWYRLIFKTSAHDRFVFAITQDTATSPVEYLGDASRHVFATAFQAEVGSTASAYQKVTSTFDVTEAGQADKYYLFHGGSADPRWMVTPTITPGIDKVQVFAGVRKLSDAALGIVFEYSATVDTNNGSFYLAAPVAAGTANYLFRSKGTSGVNASYTNAAVAAPITNVLSGLGDISGDLAALRVNGTQVAQSTGDQGTGNFLAYPLYIGSRAGTSLYFNGQLYSLIARFGPNLDANTITQTEKFVASKTAGVSL